MCEVESRLHNLLSHANKWYGKEVRFLHKQWWLVWVQLPLSRGAQIGRRSAKVGSTPTC